MNRMGQDGKVKMMALASFAHLAIIITTFCYLKVIKRIQKAEKILSAQSLSTNFPDNDITRAKLKISLYTFIPIIQYTPILVFSFCYLLDLREEIQHWAYILFIVLFNVGGVIKTLTFLITTKWKRSTNINKTNNNDNDNDNNLDVSIGSQFCISANEFIY